MPHESPRFDWGSLGLVNENGAPVECPEDGPFTLIYWAPWCEDCRSQWSSMHQFAVRTNGRAAFVGCFAPPAELRDFLANNPVTVPTWIEPSEKAERDRLRTFHAFLRQLTGDTRRWGLPAIRELMIEDGRFVVRWM